MATALTVAPAPARPRFCWVPYLNLLRVQIITGTLLVFGPPLALLSPVFRGLFDLRADPWWRTLMGTALVTLAALSTAWTLLATSWVTIFNAPARFNTCKIARVKYPIGWPERELFALLAAPLLLTATLYSWSASRVAPWLLLFGVFLGLAAALGLLLFVKWSADWLQRAAHRPEPRGVIPKGVRLVVSSLDRPTVRDGFIDVQTGELAPGHMVVWVSFAFSVVLYVAIGYGKWLRLGYPTNVSTLACVLLLVLMLCWFFVGLTFLLDPYRLSPLIVAAAGAFVIGFLPVPGGDHLYRTWPRSGDLSPWSYQVLQRGSATPILVAATGGGIQAAAWSARVLAGIDESLSADLKDEFTDSIRLFSTVSGGGVGVMYFAERYRAGHFDHQYGRPNAVVQRAEVSSLDDAAWGAAFPDAIATFLPPIRMIFGDRGQALEVAWTRSQEVGRLLSDWRTEVWSDVRPANIFNATLVDTGERLLIGTSRVGWRQKRGLRNFEDVYPDREIQVVTAARLAASFTYVSPATRTDAHETPYHVVDGGYYDDYGMTTLTEWLDEALEGVGGEASFPQVLVIQIRSDSGRANPSANTWLHGVLYQAWAPVETILKVRTTGQISHNDEEFERLQRLWKDKNVKIYNVVFRFCGEHPPLSWHLTETEKNAIEAEWQRQREGPGVQAIRNFLRHQPIADTRADAPLDVPLTPCP